MKKFNWILILLFTTIACKKEKKFDYPLVFTGDVINISDTSATFTAKISNTGKFPIIESGFIWSLRSKDDKGIKIKNEGIEDGIYRLQTNLKLLPGKAYYVRAYIQTEFTTTYGNEVTFNSIDGQIEKGKWSSIYYKKLSNISQEYTDVLSSFTINDNTFFAIANGTLYCYRHIENTYSYILSNPILSHAYYSVAVNSYAYIFSDNAFYRFDPQTLSFSKLSIFNGKTRFSAVGFIIKDNIYFGLGSDSNNIILNDFWKYNITSDTWQQVLSFPGKILSGDFAFSINNLGYVGGQVISFYPYTSGLWCYNPETDKWIQKHNFSIKNFKKIYPYAMSLNHFGYCFNGILSEYNPSFDYWETMDNYLFCYNITFAFSANNKIFVFEEGHTIYNDGDFEILVYEK